MSRKTHNSIFNDEQRQFIRDNYLGISSSELTKMLNEKFGTQFEVKSIMNFKQNNKLKSGIDVRFKKGSIPPNYREVGSERINVDGYFEIKTGNCRKGWMAKHKYLYEKYKGEVPKGHIVIFADGNTKNLDLDNLVLVSRQELLYLNRNHLIYNDSELTKAGIMVAKLMTTTNARRKEVKK